MAKKEKIVISIINGVLFLAMLLGMIFFLTELERYIRAAVFALIAVLSLATYAFMFFKLYKLSRSAFTANIFLFILLLCFFILNVTGIFENTSDILHIEALILESGTYGIVICFILILFNVIVLPAPSFIFYIAITAVYGASKSFLICYTGTLLGSIIAFFIGRVLGKRAVGFCIGQNSLEKYSELLNKKGTLPFIIMQILPFFPDDILCMVAGLSSMSFKFFTLSMILIRPIYIAFVCFLGTGEIIPFKGWGIAVWIAIFAFIISLSAVYYKHQDKVDEKLKKVFKIK